MTDQIFEITLSTLTYSGDALGKLPDGRVCFVPFGLPGERVRIRLTNQKHSFTRAQLLEVLEASPERITPRCLHFGECGGCHYQHIRYGHQLKVKEDILRDQLQRIGKIDNPLVVSTVASPDPWNYRNHIQFHLTEAGQVGYVRATHARVTSDRSARPLRSADILPITECHLPEARINAVWPSLELEAQTEIERVSIRVGVGDNLMLVLESKIAQIPPPEAPAGVSVVNLFGDETIVMSGNDHLMVRLGERDFRVSAGSFFQVNTHMAQKMVEHLLDRLTLTPESVVLDVYCGVGTFSAFLAPVCRQVIGVEMSPGACADFEINLNEFDNVTLYEGRAEEIIPHLDVLPDIVIVDPPRSGLGRATLDAILRLGPKTIAYVSCDPSTLARDAARFINGRYRLLESTPFDLFPQTYHIESISLFER